MTFSAAPNASNPSDSVNTSRRSWQLAEASLALAISHATRPNTASYNIVMHVFETASKWAKAFDLLHRLDSWKLRFSVVSYNTAISACRYRSQWRGAVLLLGSLTEAYLKCNQITLSAAIVACSHRKWEALSLFDTICTRAMKPNSISYGAVLDACEKSSSWSLCSKLLDDMLSTRLEVTGVEVGCLLSAARKAHGSNFAQKLLKRMRCFLELHHEPYDSYDPYDLFEPHDPETFGSGKSFELTLGTVLLERPGILVVNKPSGTSSEDFVNLMEVALAVPLFAVSRLDHPTSGVLPLATESRIFQWLKAQFAGRLVVKEYLCLCQGPALGPVGHTGRLAQRLRPATSATRTEVSSWGKEALTVFTVVARYADGMDGMELIQLRVQPVTGRKHQIRAHLANIGRPVVGDRKYGRRCRSDFPMSRLFLHCHYLKFFDLQGEEVIVEAPLPADLCNILRNLKQKY
eukprot:s983_g7.t1